MERFNSSAFIRPALQKRAAGGNAPVLSDFLRPFLAVLQMQIILNSLVFINLEKRISLRTGSDDQFWKHRDPAADVFLVEEVDIMKEITADYWDYEADIVIVGFGGAGACAAIEANDAGASVILLEKQPREHHYSNTRMSGGGFHSPDPSGGRNALKSYAKAMFSGENLPWKFEGEQPEYSDGLAELWAEYAPQNAEFMTGLDPEFEARPHGASAYPGFPGAAESKYQLCNSTYDKNMVEAKLSGSPKAPPDKKVAGEAFHQCLLRGLERRKIPVHYETRAMEIIRNDEGVIIGVSAVNGNREVNYRARKAVILTSGGYEYSPALRSAFLDGPSRDGWAFYGTPENTGDGIIMGMRVGAGLSKAGSCAGRLIGSFPDLRRKGLRVGVQVNAIGKGNAIVVDSSGNRFCSERDITLNPTSYISYRYALQFDVKRCLYPRIPAWFVFDETLRTLKSLVSSNITEYFGVPWSQDNHEAIERGWILKADTIEELAAKIKAHPDNHGQMVSKTLRRTVDQFNMYCEQGEDRDFHRPQDTLSPVESAPFYALPLFPGGPNTKGGLKANEKRQVVDWNGQVIPRLYAAGEISSVFKFAYQAGGNVAECIVFGRAAGRYAAAESST